MQMCHSVHPIQKVRISRSVLPHSLVTVLNALSMPLVTHEPQFSYTHTVTFIRSPYLFTQRPSHSEFREVRRAVKTYDTLQSATITTPSLKAERWFSQYLNLSYPRAMRHC